MRRRSMVRWAAVFVAVLVAGAAAGCGGGKKSSSTTTTTVAASATTTAAAATTAASTTSKTPSFASTKNCRQLSELGAKMSQAIQASSGGGASSLGDEAKLFKAMADAAPDEIRGDFQTFAAAFTAYAEALSKTGYTPGKTPTAEQIAALTQAAKSFSAPKLVAAEKHLSAWAQKNCGIGK